jgi:hypothetical protein
MRSRAAPSHFSLVDRWLDDTHGEGLAAGSGVLRQPPRTEADMGRDQQQRDRDPRRQMAAIGEKARHGEDEDGERAHAEQAGQGHGLHQERDRHGDIADRIPRKAGQDGGPHPFGRPEGQCQRGNPAETVAPHQPRGQRRQPVEYRQAGRQHDHGKRQRPGKILRLDKKGVPDPEKPREEIAEAEPPPDGERRKSGPHPALSRRGPDTVEQPDNQCE